MSSSTGVSSFHATLCLSTAHEPTTRDPCPPRRSVSNPASCIPTDRRPPARAAGRAAGCQTARCRAESRGEGGSGGGGGQDAANKASLDALDRQLDFLSGQSGAVPRGVPPPSPPEERPPPAARPTRESGDGWPEFDDNFLVYTAGFLLLLTTVTNTVFRVSFSGEGRGSGGGAARQGSLPDGWWEFGKVYRPGAAPALREQPPS